MENKFTCVCVEYFMSKKCYIYCQPGGLVPVISALWEAEAGRSPKAGVQDQLGQHGETLSLLKIQKLTGHVDMHL